MLKYGKCECFLMQMLYVCVLCASSGSSPDKLQETQLPPLLMFDNMLTGESFTDEDYTLAKQVWKNFA